MDLLIADNSVPAASRDVIPTTGTPQWATDGNPTSSPVIPATSFPAAHYNMLMAELYNVVLAAGIEPDGKDWNQVYKAIKSMFNGGRLLKVREFTSSGTYVPTAGTSLIKVRGCGAGGPGGYAFPNPTSGNVSAAGGGGAGAECEFWLVVTDQTSIAVTIGAAAAAVASSEQNTGGASSFGIYATLGAGSGGIAGASIAGNSGAVAALGAGGQVLVWNDAAMLYPVFRKTGMPGTTGVCVFGSNSPGFGGVTAFGAPSFNSNNGAGTTGIGYGGGGTGGGSNSSTGFIGAEGEPGFFIVEEYS